MAQPSNRSSCLDPVRDRESFARRRGVRLAVLTFASRDLVAQCHLFMRFYIHVERIPIADIHVLMNEASDEIRGCFGEYPLPRKNIIDLTQPGVQRARNATGARYREQHRSRALMQKQRELLNGGYSHTLLADLDEFVMAAPDKYSSLYDYLQQNPHRRTAAPRHAYEVQVVEAEEPPLNWTAAPLLRGQRSVMVPVCGMRKPILSRVPSHFTFSTHNMKMPLFFACSPNKWGSTFDCLDDALWLIHTKCIDMALPLRSAALIADKDRGGGDASDVAAWMRRRCGAAGTWRKKCKLGPTLGGRDSPDGPACRKPFVLHHVGPEQHLVHVERIPAWLQDRL